MQLAQALFSYMHIKNFELRVLWIANKSGHWILGQIDHYQEWFKRGRAIVYADRVSHEVKNPTPELMQRWVIQSCCKRLEAQEGYWYGFEIHIWVACLWWRISKKTSMREGLVLMAVLNWASQASLWNSKRLSSQSPVLHGESPSSIPSSRAGKDPCPSF